MSGNEMTTVSQPWLQCSTRRAGMPAELSSTDTQMFVSNSATGCTSLGSHLSAGCGDIGFDRGRAISAGSLLDTRQQGLELGLPLGFGVDGHKANLSRLQT